MRKQLTKGHIVVTIGNIVLHIGLMYFRPIRQTFVSLEADEPAVQYAVDAYRATYNSRGWLHVLTDIEALLLLNLDAPLTVHVQKLLSLNMKHTPYIPGTKLLVDRLMPPLNEPLPFWQGAEKELALERERRHKEVIAARRRRERDAAAGGEPPAKRRRTQAPRVRHPQKPAAKRTARSKAAAVDPAALQDKEEAFFLTSSEESEEPHEDDADARSMSGSYGSSMYTPTRRRWLTTG